MPEQPLDENGFPTSRAGSPPRAPVGAATGSHAGASRGPAPPVGSIADLFLPPAQPDEIGRLGDYRILRQLGAGGMGAVYLAEETKLQRKVALKFLLPAVAADPNGKARFIREARAAAGVRHENVIVIYEVNEVSGVPYIAMERLKGLTLDEWIRTKGVPPLKHIKRMAREILSGLQAAHDAGLIHRDIKPANIWLEAPSGKVKLLDFGLAKATGEPADGDDLTNTGAVMGTPAYMSPEQARGQKLDHRTDLFSVGAVLYQLATGERPFGGGTTFEVMARVLTHQQPPPAQFNPELPADFDRLIQQMLAKNPADRPPSAAAAIARLSGPTASRSVDSIPAASSMNLPAMPPAPPGLTATTLPPNVPAPPAPAPPAPLPSLPPGYPQGPAVVVYASAPPPTVTNAADGTQTDDRPRRRRRDEYDDRGDDRYRPRDRQSGSDTAGSVSVVLGILSVVSLFLCFCGGYFVAAPMALAGLGAGFFARGGNRVAGILLNGFALLPGLALLFFFTAIMSSCGLRPDKDARPTQPHPNPLEKTKGGSSSGATTPPAPAKAESGTLEIQFDDEQDFSGMELFVDGTKRELPSFGRAVSLDVPSGSRTVAVRLNGAEVHTKTVTVKPAAQGKAVHRVEKLEPADRPGVLEIQLQKMPFDWWYNLQLFVDDKLVEHNFLVSFERPIRLELARGGHTVSFKKNGIEVQRDTVTVKKPSDGTTFHKVNLADRVVTQITIKNKRPLAKGAEVVVEVDGTFVLTWPVGADKVQFAAYVGERVIEVKFRQSGQVIEKYTQKVLPGPAIELKMDK